MAPYPPPARASQTIATVERAADVLTLFVRTRGATLGVTEIAHELGLSKAAVHRILASLCSRDYVQEDTSTRRYSLGHAAFELGLTYLARIDVRALAAPELAWLSRQTQETATLSVLVGDGRIYVDQVTPPREIVMSVPLGHRFPLHAGSSSKALLAFLPDDEVERYLGGGLEPLTESTRPTPMRCASTSRTYAAGDSPSAPANGRRAPRPWQLRCSTMAGVRSPASACAARRSASPLTPRSPPAS